MKKQDRKQDLLRDRTGKPRRRWFTWVQTEIGRASVPTSDPNHDHTHVTVWLRKLVDAVAKIPPGRRDENMFAASVLVLILLYWLARLWRAKIMDPRRPVRLRKKSYRGLLAFRQEVLTLLMDETDDPKLFPGQEWDDPHSPTAKDGSFV
jgi:hypothetical protein